MRSDHLWLASPFCRWVLPRCTDSLFISTSLLVDCLQPDSQCVHSGVQLTAAPWTVAPARLLCPWNFLGKNTGVGCHFLLQGRFLTLRQKEALSSGSPALTGRFFTTVPPGKPLGWIFIAAVHSQVFHSFCCNGKWDCFLNISF